MTMTESTMRNGVDVTTLFATIDAVKAQPEAATFQFRVGNRWESGTHSQSHINGFFGAGAEQTREQSFVIDADHPVALVGTDLGATPAELLLAALAACLTAGIGNIAAARKVELHEVESTVEGDCDLRGVLGIDDSVRNGFSAIRVSFRITGDAPAEKLAEVVEQATARSAVYDTLTNGAPVAIRVDGNVAAG
jgi:uncharacterized OsmC-like protein